MENQPKIAILGGTGALGSGLAKRWVQAGFPVIVGSRTAEKAQEAANALTPAAGGPAPTGMSRIIDHSGRWCGETPPKRPTLSC